jgi:hypothetical protein
MSIRAAEIIEDLQAALEELQAISDDLDQTPGAREGERDEKGAGSGLAIQH